MPNKKAAASKRQTKAGTAGGRTRVRRQQNYSAKAGDTLRSVAEKFEVPIKFLARANNLAETATLNAGTTLHIPELRFDPFGKVAGGWVEIAPIWYEKNPTRGEERFIVAKTRI